MIPGFQNFYQQSRAYIDSTKIEFTKKKHTLSLMHFFILNFIHRSSTYQVDGCGTNGNNGNDEIAIGEIYRRAEDLLNDDSFSTNGTSSLFVGRLDTYKMSLV